MNQKITPRMPNAVELDGVIRGLDNASEYCGETHAFDSQRSIREAAAAISLLRFREAELVKALNKAADDLHEEGLVEEARDARAVATAK